MMGHDHSTGGDEDAYTNSDGSGSDSSSSDAEASLVFEAYLLGRLAGEDIQWDEFRQVHASFGPALDRLHADYLRGEALLQAVGLDAALDDDAASMEERMRTLLEDLGKPGTAANFHVLGPIARGGMAEIDRVWDSRLRRPLARKALPFAVHEAKSSHARRKLSRFLEEARIGSQLQHPGILPIHEIGIDARGRLFFTMPIVRGHHLGHVITQVHAGGRTSIPAALSMLVSICDTVAYAHSKHVVHRDLKPENVMVGRFGQVYVMDWGLAKVLPQANPPSLFPVLGDASLEIDSVRRSLDGEARGSSLSTIDGDVVGTPGFMAPEQAAGDLARVDLLSDQYAVGAILYFLLTGKRPYSDRSQSTTVEEMLAIVRNEAPTPIQQLAPRTPPELIAICNKAMHREPSARYSSLEGLAADLRAYLEGRVVIAHDSGALVSLGKWMRRNRAVALAIISTLIVTIGGLVAHLVRENVHRQHLAAVNRDLHKTQTDLASRVEELKRAAYFNDIDFVQRAQAAGNDGGEVKRVLAACNEKQRGWEWHFLRRQSDTSSHRFEGGWTAALSADEKLVATVLDVHNVVVYELATRRRVRTFSARGYVDALCFDPASRNLAAWSRDQVVRVLELESGIVHEFSWHADRHPLISYTEDGAALLITSHSRAAILDAKTGATIVDLGPRAGRINCMGSSGEGRFALGTNIGVVEIFETRTWRCTGRLEASSKSIVALRFANSGKQLFVADNAGKVCSYDGGTLTRNWQRDYPHDLGIARDFASIDASGRYLARARSCSIEIIDFASEDVRLLHGHEARVGQLFFGKGGRVVAVAEGDSTRIWDLEQSRVQRLLTRVSGRICDLSIRPDGRALAITAGRSIVIQALPGGASRRIDAQLGNVRRARFSPQGSDLVAIGERRLLARWDAQSFEAKSPIYVEVMGAQTMAFTPDGKGLFTGVDSLAWYNAAVWDLEAGGGGKTFSLPIEPMDGVFAPDGSRFALAGKDGAVHIHATVSGAKLCQVDVSDRALKTVAWSPDGRLVVAGGFAARSGWDIDVIDAASGTLVGSLPGHTQPCNALAFSHDGRLFSAGDDGLRVWDVERRRCLLELAVPPNQQVFCLALTPDSRMLIAGTSAGEVRVWQL